MDKKEILEKLFNKTICSSCFGEYYDEYGQHQQLTLTFTDNSRLYVSSTDLMRVSSYLRLTFEAEP